MSNIVISHEHPDWFKPLFAELEKRGLSYETADPTQHHYAIEESAGGISLFFNRMSPSAYLRGGVQGTFYTLNYLKHLEENGVRVINGYKAFVYETSKALQLQLLQKLGIKYPKSRVINHASQLEAATEGLRFPIVVKANIGGSGAGIEKFNDIEEVREAVKNGQIDLGIDHTALVQEFIPARGGHITRVETLGGKYLYAIKVYTSGESFNLCPADICQTTTGQDLVRNACAVDAPKNGLKVEADTPQADVIQNIETIVQQSGIDVGGIEYIIDDRDGEVLYYDVNALSNFVADAVNVIGFNPHERLVDYLEQEAVRSTVDEAVAQ
ncbi:ATP-grasp domain-containing protein [Mucilaginibacter daejeonensis]|uniref:ATP-grasp domain-containing protein n=1 Tax=Mucilaginibacter daejeonensis TaxID=398049 RepID=UPI001D17B2AD|nr:ATP-grasp domain-containing protein [Mucilaginibacter daejeonensis]UEG52137.1 ATP-grasp domain-containing protein [Mucilaginibacter daejeonensis]